MKYRDPSLYLTHILESIELARSYVAGVEYVEFSENPQLQDAVVRRIEIIGEAVKKAPTCLTCASESPIIEAQLPG